MKEGDLEASGPCYSKGRRDFEKEGVASHRTGSEGEETGTEKGLHACQHGGIGDFPDAISVPWWRQESRWGWPSGHHACNSGQVRGTGWRTACKYMGS